MISSPSGCCQYNRGQNHRVGKRVLKGSIKQYKWAIALATTTGMLTLGVVLFNGENLASLWQGLALGQSNASSAQTPLPALPEPELGPRLQLNYDQWVSLLQREAQVVAVDRPPRLAVLAGDSLSLWFPVNLLPPGMTWLNQGISGETSAGLLRRLDLFDQTQPQVIFILAGINDLIHGIGPATVLANTEAMVQRLRVVHPRSRIVVQSILPHGDRALILERLRGEERPVWAESLPTIPNTKIRELNSRLAKLAERQNIDYLDLHAAFTTPAGLLRPDLTTDGLHLNAQGYEVWRSQLTAYLDQTLPPEPAASP